MDDVSMLVIIEHRCPFHFMLTSLISLIANRFYAQAYTIHIHMRDSYMRFTDIGQQIMVAIPKRLKRGTKCKVPCVWSWISYAEINVGITTATTKCSCSHACCQRLFLCSVDFPKRNCIASFAMCMAMNDHVVCLNSQRCRNYVFQAVLFFAHKKTAKAEKYCVCGVHRCCSSSHEHYTTVATRPRILLVV